MASSSRQWQRSRSRSSHRSRHRRTESVISQDSLSKSRDRNSNSSAVLAQNDGVSHSEPHHDQKKGRERSRHQHSNDSESSSSRKQKYEKQRVPKAETESHEPDINNSLKNWWEVPPQIRRGRGRGRGNVAGSWDPKMMVDASTTGAGTTTNPEYNQAMMMRFSEMPLPHITRAPPMGNAMMMSMRPPLPSSFEENFMDEVPEYSNIGLNFDHHLSSNQSGWVRRVPLMHPFANTFRKGRGGLWPTGAAPGTSSMQWRFGSGEPRYTSYERFPPPPPGSDVIMDHNASRLETSGGTNLYTSEFQDKSHTAHAIGANEWGTTKPRFMPRIEHQDSRLMAASMFTNSSGHSVSMPINPNWFVPRYGGFPPPPPHRFEALQGTTSTPQQQIWSDHVTPSMMMLMPRRPSGGPFDSVRSNAYFSTGPTTTDLQDFTSTNTGAAISTPSDLTAPTSAAVATADSQHLFKACAAELEAFLDLETSRDLRIHSCYVHILDKIEPMFLSQKTYQFIKDSLPEELRHKLRAVSSEAKASEIDLLKDEIFQSPAKSPVAKSFPYIIPISETFISLTLTTLTADNQQQQNSFYHRNLKDLPIDILAEKQTSTSGKASDSMHHPFSHSTSFELSDINTTAIIQGINNALTTQQQVRWQHFVSAIRSSVSLNTINVLFLHLFPPHYSSTTTDSDKNAFYPASNYNLKVEKLRDIDCTLPSLLPLVFECFFKEPTPIFQQTNLLSFVEEFEPTREKPLLTNRCIELALTLIANRN